MKVKKHLKRVKPCPNCESKYLTLQAYPSIDKNSFWIECYRCSATGERGKNVKEAVDLWNKER